MTPLPLVLQTADEVRNVVGELREKYGEHLKVGAQGFCWGGCFTVLLLGMSHTIVRMTVFMKRS